jgi:DNA-binding CsgD family transcriptional regulator/tetratricopeptide (TPR) repeat protein
VGAAIPLVARNAELATLTSVIDAVPGGSGGVALITGEAGIGKTRLLQEARREADLRGLLVLRGRAVESGGAYRPLVEAFALPAAPFAQDPGLVGVRPTLARVLPGWIGGEGILAPMADPAAVLAGSLILLLQAMAPDGSVLIIDDLHWADGDTLSVLSSLVDAAEELPLALIMAARSEPFPSTALDRLASTRSIHRLSLRRLTPIEVSEAVRAAELSGLAPERLQELITATDGLPLILDELVRQLRENGSGGGKFDVRQTTLASAVQLRLTRVPPDCRVILDALSVLGEADTELLMAVSGQDDSRVSAALHDALTSTLLVNAATPLGVGWRHPLIRDAVRDLLLPLEQQALARRAADCLADEETASEGQAKHAAIMFELAGYPYRAAQQYVRAARMAVRNAALNAAESYLAEAHRLTDSLPDAAWQVLIERIEILAVAGRGGDAYRSGMAALRSVAGRDARPLIVATARAAYGANLEGAAISDHVRAADAGSQLLARLQAESDEGDPDLAMLRAHAALAERRSDAVALGQRAAALATEVGRFDLACEALLLAGIAARRRGLAEAEQELLRALSLSRDHKLPLWEVRVLGELGRIGMMTSSDTTVYQQERALATACGMAGSVAHSDLRIGETISIREGYVAAYPTLVRADAQARQLQLTGLYAETRAQLAGCLVHAGDRPLPGTIHAPTPAEIDALIAEALSLGKKSKPIPWAMGVVGLRAWLDGDNTAAIRLIHDSMEYLRHETKIAPLWGVGLLLQVLAGADPDELFGPTELMGHHANRAAHAYGTAVSRMRRAESATASIAEAEHHARQAPFMRHMLRTIVAPALFTAGFKEAESWLREADAFCGESGEGALQRRVRAALGTIGAKVPRLKPGLVPPHLAKLGVTARETEILRLLKAGLSNADIADRLVISVRTVESHVSSMLMKTGKESRDQLPSLTDR